MTSETPTNQPRDLDTILDAVESDLATMPPEEARMELARRVVGLQFTQTLAVAIDAIWALASELANARKQQDQPAAAESEIKARWEEREVRARWAASAASNDPIPMSRLDVAAGLRDGARLELSALHDSLAHNGHGHIVPNVSGTRERCGGPVACRECHYNQERLEALIRACTDADELLAEALLRTVNADEETAE